MKSYQKNEVKERVQILDSESIIETACKGLLNLCVSIGMDVMHQLLEMDVAVLAGEKGKHNAERQAYRHGRDNTKVVMGGEKVKTTKPRVRSKDGVELPLPTLAYFQQEDALDEAVVARVLMGLSTRKYANTLEYGDDDSACTSKSEVSRRFKAGLEKIMEEFFNRPIEEDYFSIMIDGMSVGKMTVVAAMGITDEGKKRMLGIIAGATENSTAVKALLDDLITRGLKTDRTMLFVLDGAKALHKAVTDTFGEHAIIQRCQIHKKRNVLSYLPKSEQSNVGLLMSKAYMEFEYEQAKKQLNKVARYLESRYPDAADSLREGMEETLTVHRLEVPGKLRKTLSNTNAIESANSVAASMIRRVTNWKDGEMVLRHMAAGYLEAEHSFRRISGYREIPLVVSAMERLTQKDNEQLIEGAVRTA